MKVRSFKPADAEFCFNLRSNAFKQKFCGELTPQDVAAAVNSYLPDVYIRMAQETPIFIVEKKGTPVGFFTLKRRDGSTTELPQIYLDLDRLGRGIGTACITYIEKWLAENWPEVNTLVVDTVIPKYNSGFYKKVGFIPGEFTYCEFSGRKLRALRLVKHLRS